MENFIYRAILFICCPLNTDLNVEQWYGNCNQINLRKYSMGKVLPYSPQNTKFTILSDKKTRKCYMWAYVRTLR